MFISLYITDSKNSLVFQYLLGSNSPPFSHILTRIRAICPGLLSKEDDKECGLALYHCSVAKNLEVCKYHSQINNLNYYCLTSVMDSRPQIETFTFLQLLDQTLLEYFDKDRLDVSKIINNYDRVTMIIYMCIDAGEPYVGSFNSNRIKRIIPAKSDLSKVINNTAQTLQRAVRQPSHSILASASEKMLSNEEVVPWRSGHLKYANEEIYVDIIETIHVIYQVNGHRHHHGSLQMVSGTINGRINVKSYLSGNPTVEMDVDWAGNQNQMYAQSFHDCVEASKGSPSFLQFIPPDGICNLLNYTIDEDLDTEMNPTEKKVARTNSPIGVVSVSYRDELGPNSDEFEIHVNISNSPSVSKIQDLIIQLQLQSCGQESNAWQGKRQRDREGESLEENDQDIQQEEDQVEAGKIRVLRNTHGRFDNSVLPGKGTWIFDSETPVGSLPVLRGCVENSNSPVKIQRVGISYTHEGLLPSGIRLRKLNVRSASNLRENNRGSRLFKGVKYVCRTGDYELRSL